MSSNLPCGVLSTDLPGNRASDDLWDRTMDEIVTEWTLEGVDESHCGGCNHEATCHQGSRFYDGSYCPGLESETETRVGMILEEG